MYIYQQPYLAQENSVLLKWSPRLSDNTICVFFLWGALKTKYLTDNI